VPKSAVANPNNNRSSVLGQKLCALERWKAAGGGHDERIFGQLGSIIRRGALRRDPFSLFTLVDRVRNCVRYAKLTADPKQDFRGFQFHQFHHFIYMSGRERLVLLRR